jgi:hypothetical protein
MQYGGPKVLTNVYYIPKLKRNIISLGTLAERGCKIVIEDDYLWGYDRQRKLMMKVERSKNRLYYLDLDRVDPVFQDKSKSVTHDIICEKEKSWHPAEAKGADGVDIPAKHAKKHARYMPRLCQEILNFAVASINEGCTCTGQPEDSATLGSNQASSSGTSAEAGDPEHACTPGISPGCSARSRRPEVGEPEGSGSSGGAPREELGRKQCPAKSASCEEKITEAGDVVGGSMLPGRPSAEAPESEGLSSPESGHDGDSSVVVLTEPEETNPEARGRTSASLEGVKPVSCYMELARKLNQHSLAGSGYRWLGQKQRPESYELVTFAISFEKYFDKVVSKRRIEGKTKVTSTDEQVKTEDADKDGKRQAMEKPAKVKLVTWKTQRATKAMSTMMTETVKAIPRVTPTHSKWRIWDPGRSEAHVVLRGVIVRIKHVLRQTASCVASVSYTSGIRNTSWSRFRIPSSTRLANLLLYNPL